MPSCLKVSALLTALFASWFGYQLHKQRQGDGGLSLTRAQWDWTVGAALPRCTKPMVFKNLLDFQGEDHCKQEDGRCADFIVDRLVELFGDREISAFPPTHVTQYAENTEYEHESMSVRDYFRDAKYRGWLVHTQHNLAVNQSGYRKFWEFLPKAQDIFSRVYEDTSFRYAGSQVFFAQLTGSGSPLHFAVGMNVFAMLGGRKRWMLLDPAYLDDANCTIGYTGLYGGCHPNGMFPPSKKIDIDEYKEILMNEKGVPAHAIFDVTLEPGDVLVNCPFWAHSIMNLDPVTVAYSFRTAQFLRESPWFLMHWMRGLAHAMHTRFFVDSSRYTMIDAVRQRSHGFLDTEPRLSKRSFTNSRMKSVNTP